jgi:hypothetical protein
VILSRDAYDRLQNKTQGIWSSLQRFRKLHDLTQVDADKPLEGVRNRATKGRRDRR